MSKQPLTPREFKSIYSKVPRICVDLIITKRKKILLTKRSISPFKGWWHFPGGTVRYREKILTAVKRVAKQELGISLKSFKLVGYEEAKYSFRHDVALALVCRLGKNQKPKPVEQASEVKFFDQIPKKTISFQKQFIKDNREKILFG